MKKTDSKPIVNSDQTTSDGTNVTPQPLGYFDPSKAYQNVLNNMGSIQLYHIPTNETIVFKAFVTTFQDNYTSTWNEEMVYGRMDPIPTFESTVRKISLEFEVPADSVEGAIENTDKLDRLIQRLYPIYQKVDKTNVLSTAPVWRIKFANLISKTNSGTNSAKKGGLVSYIQNFSFTPNFDAGVIFNADQMYPKHYTVALDLTILHEHLPGFNKSKKFGSKKHLFPYGVGDKTKVSANKTGVQQSTDAPPQGPREREVKEARQNPMQTVLKPVTPPNSSNNP